MTTFQALMALSASQTKKAQSDVQLALLQRQRNEETRKKQQEAQEAKQREMEKKLRMKHFEEQQRERERIQRMEEAKRQKEAELQRREEEQRDALRYGPKKAKSSSNSDGSSPKWPSSSSQNRAREEVRRRRFPSDDDADDSAPEFLTREEKRKRKQDAEMRKLFSASKRTSASSSYSKAGKRLPGGAIDVTTSSNAVPSHSGLSAKSVKARIAAMPITLTKLNVVKRDTRTIDEIVQDMAKAKEGKVLQGDQAREYNDWFTSHKKKDPPKRPATSAPTSGANTPAPQDSSARTGSQQSVSSATSQRKIPTPAPAAKSAPSKATSKLSASAVPGSSKAPSATSKLALAEKRTVTSRPAPSTAVKSTKGLNGSSYGAASSALRKRPRSSSRSESPPPKRRVMTPELDVKDEIWKMFGRDRNRYVAMDVFSDDEDMEADATILEREEKISARIAKREDVQALEEERRHEEEKRRRKKEREARERRLDD